MMPANMPDSINEAEMFRLFPERTRRGSSLMLHTHCMFPNGDHVTLEVFDESHGTTISDAGSAWEAITSAGVDISRSAIVKDAITSAGVEGFRFAIGEFYAREVPAQEFDSTALLLANFAQSWAHKIISRHHRSASNSLEERLLSALVRTYGPDAVSKGGSILGASTREYGITAAVALPRERSALFEAVASHPLSISAAFTAMTDIGKAHPTWPRLAVVNNIGHWAARDVALLSDCTEAIVDIEDPERLLKTVRKALAA